MPSALVTRDGRGIPMRRLLTSSAIPLGLVLLLVSDVVSVSIPDSDHLGRFVLDHVPVEIDTQARALGHLHIAI